MLVAAGQVELHDADTLEIGPYKFRITISADPVATARVKARLVPVPMWSLGVRAESGPKNALRGVLWRPSLSPPSLLFVVKFRFKRYSALPPAVMDQVSCGSSR